MLVVVFNEDWGKGFGMVLGVVVIIVVENVGISSRFDSSEVWWRNFMKNCLIIMQKVFDGFSDGVGIFIQMVVMFVWYIYYLKIVDGFGMFVQIIVSGQ